MKKFYLSALGCLLAMGASAQKIDQVGTMQGETWSLQSIPTEYAYNGKSSVYTINETETDVEFTVYNKSFAVDRTIKVANPTSYNRTVVESREAVIKPIEMGVVDCGNREADWLYEEYRYGQTYPKWWAYNKCNNTAYTAEYVPQWLEYMKKQGAFEDVTIVSKTDYDGGTLFVTNRTFEDGSTYALYFKENALVSVSYSEGTIIDTWDQGNYDGSYYLIYNMQTAEFTQESIVEYINRGELMEFKGYGSFDSYQVDSIIVKDDGSTYFYTNTYYDSYEYGKQYPRLYFIWKGESLEAYGLRYDVSFTGEWKKSEEAYSLDGWLLGTAMTPFHVGSGAYSDEGFGSCATQTFFNNDEKWEFLRPVFEEVTDDYREDDWDGDGEIDHKQTRYVNKPKALEVVSENGNVLTTIALPEADYYYPLAIQWDGDTYFGLSISIRVETDEINPDTESYYYYEEFVNIYSIDKNASSVKKIASTPAMRVSPAVANRNSTINVTLDAETAKNGGELVITDSNGRTVGRSRVEAGQTSVPVTTDRMGSGVYNITLTEKGQKVENARIIVK